MTNGREGRWGLVLLSLVLLCAFLLLSGCAYFNTFYNAQALYREGVKLAEANNPSQARGKLESAIKKSASVIKNYPKSRWVDDALFMAGMCYFQMGEYGKSIAKFDNLNAVFPWSEFRDDAEFWRAISLVNDREYARGIAILRGLRDSSHQFREAATLELAAAAYKQGDYQAAIKSFQAFEVEFPRSPRRKALRRQVAETYFALGQYELAARAFAEHRKLAEHSRERALDDLSIAECYLLGKCPDSSLALMQRQGDRYPEYGDRVNLLLGKAHLAMGKKPEAYQALSRVKTGSLAAEAYFLIGRSLEEDTSFASALAYYDTARMRDPSSSYAVQAGSRRLLIARLISGLKGEGDTAQSRFLLAEVYHLNLVQDGVAVQQYQKVVDSFPKSPYAAKALYAKAWISHNRLKAPDSLLAYQDLVDRYPRTVYAQEARKVLGLPLLPQFQIEKTAEQKAESIRTVAARDSLVAAKRRSDSLAQATAPPAPATPPSVEPPVKGEPGPTSASGRSERGRDRREHRERPPGLPALPELPRVGPAAGDTGQKPVIPPVEPKGTQLIVPPEQEHPPIAPTTPSPSIPPTKVEPESAKSPVRPAPAPSIADSSPAPTPPKEKENPPITQITPPKIEPESVKSVDNSKIGLAPGRYLPDSALKSIYFAFDRAVVRAQDQGILLANGEFLKKHPELKIQIAGFCDPRGAAEYNLGLGLRRAEAARNWLVQFGIEPGRIQVISFGEERARAISLDLYWFERRCEFWTSR